MISSISNNFNGMSSEGISSDVFVDSALIVEEIFVDGEGSGDGSVSDEVFFDVINGAESVGRSGFVFVTSVTGIVSSSAIFVAFRGNLSDIRASGESRINVMRAFFHSVRITSRFISKISSRNNSGSSEPTPRSTNLSSIASHTKTAKESTASSGVGN